MAALRTLASFPETITHHDASFDPWTTYNEGAAALGEVDGRGRPDVLIGDYDTAYLFLGEE